jgi:hypothetical protein
VSYRLAVGRWGKALEKYLIIDGKFSLFNFAD